MRRVIIFFCCVIFLLSCGKEERPSDILSPEEMAASLTELYITEAKITSLPVGRDSSLQIFDYFEAKTFEKLEFTDTVFKKSYNYYLDRPNEMEKIYTVVIDSLNLREQRAEEKRAEEKPKIE